MAESAKPNIPADGWASPFQDEAKGQVLCGAPSHSPGADQVTH